jgi:hypothetical protein
MVAVILVVLVPKAIKAHSISAESVVLLLDVELSELRLGALHANEGSINSLDCSLAEFVHFIIIING